MDKIILKISKSEILKIQYALNHIPLTDDEHIDDILEKLNDMIDKKLEGS